MLRSSRMKCGPLPCRRQSPSVFSVRASNLAASAEVRSFSAELLDEPVGDALLITRSLNSVGDERENLLGPPRICARTEFHRCRKSSSLDSRPPTSSRDWDWSVRRQYLVQPDEPVGRKCVHQQLHLRFNE